MRTFLINSEELLDRTALEFLEAGKEERLIPCTWLRFNERIKLVFFTDRYRSLAELRGELSTEELCGVCMELLELLQRLEAIPEMETEQLVLDEDSIYLTPEGETGFLCLPALLPEDLKDTEIFAKRIYALLGELLEGASGGSEICRRMEAAREDAFADWDALREVLSCSTQPEEDSLTLRCTDTPQELCFPLPHANFRIGSDEEQADGLIEDSSAVSPLHAVIGWKDGSYSVMDLNSTGGTCVNGQQIEPMRQIPIGKGSVLTFAGYAFTAE